MYALLSKSQVSVSGGAETNFIFQPTIRYNTPIFPVNPCIIPNNIIISTSNSFLNFFLYKIIVGINNYWNRKSLTQN